MVFSGVQSVHDAAREVHKPAGPGRSDQPWQFVRSARVTDSLHQQKFFLNGKLRSLAHCGCGIVSSRRERATRGHPVSDSRELALRFSVTPCTPLTTVCATSLNRVTSKLVVWLRIRPGARSTTGDVCSPTVVDCSPPALSAALQRAASAVSYTARGAVVQRFEVRGGSSFCAPPRPSVVTAMASSGASTSGRLLCLDDNSLHTVLSKLAPVPDRFNVAGCCQVRI